MHRSQANLRPASPPFVTICREPLPWEFQPKSCGDQGGQVSNEKSGYPGCFPGFVGDDILPSYVGIIINHESRIPIKLPGFHGKYIRPGFFRGSSGKWHSKKAVVVCVFLLGFSRGICLLGSWPSQVTPIKTTPTRNKGIIY